MRKRYIVTILTALAIVAYLTLDDQDSPYNAVPDALTDQEPDYIIEGLEAENFDENGMLTQQISAAQAIHYPMNDTTELSKPTIVLHENNLPRWGVRSESGRLLGREKILLTGEVIIVPISEDSNTFSLTTANLNIDLIKRIAETEDKVIIESDNSELNSKGMTIHLDKQLVNFKSQVRGRHDPKAN